MMKRNSSEKPKIYVTFSCSPKKSFDIICFKTKMIWFIYIVKTWWIIMEMFKFLHSFVVLWYTEAAEQTGTIQAAPNNLTVGRKTVFKEVRSLSTICSGNKTKMTVLCWALKRHRWERKISGFLQCKLHKNVFAASCWTPVLHWRVEAALPWIWPPLYSHFSRFLHNSLKHKHSFLYESVPPGTKASP